MKLRNGRGREIRTHKIQKQAFAVCLAIMTAAQTMTGYGATITAGAAPDHGSWVREGQNWKYQAADGSFANGWIHTASGWYYLDPDAGVMKTGKAVIDGKEDLIFILDSDGALIAEEDSGAAIMLLSDEEEAEDDDRILDEDTIISDDRDEKAKDQDKLDSVEGNDAELEKKQTDAAESKDTNDSASNQLTNDSDAEEDTEEVKKNTLVDEDASSEAAQNPDTEEQEVLRA